VEQAAAVSRDGHFVAFLSDRDGQMDVWVTQVGSGQFHNLTRGSAPELVNPSVRTLGFSPDSSFVTFWVRKQDGSSGGDISIWAVPTLGGQPRPYLEGVAEFDWSRDGSRLAYHTPGPGDPLFVSDGIRRAEGRPIFTAPAGLHCHFPLWAPDTAFIYFVQGSLPDKLDIWRITPAGGTPERITSHHGRVSHPVLLDRRTLMYLASDPDGSGPWLYSLDVERRIPHRLTSGLDRYTSLAASADGRRLVVALASPKRTLWRLRFADSPVEVSTAARIPLTTSTGFSPRLGPNYLLYVSATGTSESIWRAANGTDTELWSGQGARVFGGPAISPDGKYVAFSVRQHGQTVLYVMQADGTNARIVTDSLDLQGAPAWTPDGQSITSAADDHGVPHLFRVPVDGRSPALFVQEYSVDPTWAPDGRFVVYSGPDIGTTFSVKAVTAEAATHPLPALTLTRGARHLAFLPGGRALVLLRGEIQHKNLWLIDLETGAERQLTNLTPDFDIRDFDISPDGREVVLERVQERADVCCWISPDHNPASTQRHDRRAPNTGLRISCDRRFRGGTARRWDGFPNARRNRQNWALRYSWRSALMGSIRLARWAGAKLANSAAKTRMGIMMAKVDGSVGRIPFTRCTKRRPATKAANMPAPTPAKIIPRLCRSTSRMTSWALAPSAMRTPNSGTRWLVK
jgi:Tol biopolymer transport system component